MSELDDRKVLAEIELIEAQKREIRSKMRFEYLKTVSLLLGAVAVFLLLRLPDSVLRRQSVEEEKARERTSLLLEWMKESDVEKKANAIQVIRAVYGEAESEWIDRLESVVIAEARADNLQKTSDRFEELVARRKQLQVKLEHEVAGTVPGHGPVSFAIRQELEAVNAQIILLGFMLESYGIEAERVENLVPAADTVGDQND